MYRVSLSLPAPFARSTGSAPMSSEAPIILRPCCHAHALNFCATGCSTFLTSVMRLPPMDRTVSIRVPDGKLTDVCAREDRMSQRTV